MVSWNGSEEVVSPMDLSYDPHMKQPVSVTLSPDNLKWLRAQAARTHRSVSETLDRLLEDLRAGGGLRSLPSRSVVGLARIPADDPDLQKAEASLRELFDRFLGREVNAQSRKRKTAKGKRR